MNIKLKNLNKPFKFLYKYWITLALIMVLIALIRQNFVINHFPYSLFDKQKIINQNIANNQTLINQNKKLSIDLKSKSTANMEILESIARYQFRLIKSSERYYQINRSATNQDVP